MTEDAKTTAPTETPADVEQPHDDDVAGHSFRSRTRPHEDAQPGVSGALDPDIEVRS